MGINNCTTYTAPYTDVCNFGNLFAGNECASNRDSNSFTIDGHTYDLAFNTNGVIEINELKNEIEKLKKENEKENFVMKSMFNGMFGQVAPGMCRVSMSGKIAIKTSSGYKAYDVKTGSLTNCDNFAFDVGEDWFFIMPTNKVEKGDIILASGKPRCVIEAGKNEIKTFCYEDGTIETIVPERHMFMGKQYFYGKIVSLFGNMMSKEKGMNNMFKYMMMSEMTKGNIGNGNNNMMPMLMMMNGGNMFDGLFDFDDDGEDVETESEK